LFFLFRLLTTQPASIPCRIHNPENK
jgi:hypothetical protein